MDADMDMGAWVEVGGHAGSGRGRAWMVGLDGGAEGSGWMVAAGAGAGSRSREAAGTGLGAESRVCGPMGTPVGKPPSGTRAGAAVASGTAGDGSGVMWWVVGQGHSGRHAWRAAVKGAARGRKRNSTGEGVMAAGSVASSHRGPGEAECGRIAEPGAGIGAA